MTIETQGPDSVIREGERPGESPSMGQRVVRALISLREIEAQASRGGDPGRVCQLVARTIGEFMLADTVVISVAATSAARVPPVATYTASSRTINPRLVNVELASARVQALPPGALLLLPVNESETNLTLEERQALRELGVAYSIVVPLVRQGRAQGRIDILYARPVVMSQPELDLCQQLAGHAATALALAHAAAAEVEADAAELMLSVSEALRHAPIDNPSELLQAVVALLPRILHCDRSYAYLWHPERNEFLPTAVEAMREEQVAVLKQYPMNPQQVPLFEQMLYSTRPITINDVQRSTMLPMQVAHELGTHALLALPIRGRRQQALGVLILDFTSPDHQFNATQVTLAGRVVEQVQALVENASLYEEACERSDRLAVLNEIGIHLASLADLPAIFPALHAQLATVIDATALLCALIEPDGSEMTLYHMTGSILNIRHNVNLTASPILRRVLEKRRGIILHTDAAELVREMAETEMRSVPVESIVCVPMRVRHQQVIGILAAYSSFSHAYSRDDLELLSTVASQAAVAIDNARLYAQMQAKGELRGQLLDRIMSAHELERKSIVDDIHDDTLQSMVSSMYKIDLCLRLSETKNHQRELEELRDLRSNLAGNIDRLRTLIFQIRPSTLDLLGLLPTIDQYLDRLERETGIHTVLNSALESRLEIGMETLIYRLLQELLSNVRLHSQATTVTVKIEREEYGVRVEVIDDGIGFSPETVLTTDLISEEECIGVALVRERVQVAGGTFSLESQPGAGTRVQIVLPMTAGRHITGPLDEGRLTR